MYLFSRTATLTGSLSASMEWAVKVTEYIKSTHDINVSLWSLAQGAPVGTVGWSARFESHAAQAEATASIQGDQQYLNMLDEGQDFIIPGSGQDSFRQILNGGTGEGATQVAVLTTGQAANGMIADAIAFGIEANEYLSSLTGYPSAFLADAYGPFGQLTWIQGLPDMAAVDATHEKMSSDAGYMERVAGAGDLFLEGTGQRSLGQRIV